MEAIAQFVRRAQGTLDQRTPPASEWELRELLRQALALLREVDDGA